MRHDKYDVIRTYNVAINNLRFLLSESHSLTCN